MILIYIVRNSSGTLKATLYPPAKSGSDWKVDEEKVKGRSPFKELPSELFPNQTYQDAPLVLRVDEVIEFPVWAVKTMNAGNVWIGLNKPIKNKEIENGFTFEGGCMMKLDKEIHEKLLPNLTFEDSPIIISNYKEEEN